jgi:hypothetical protein
MAAIARRARAEPATAIYVTVDDMLAADPALGPERPAVGTAAQLSDAELLTLAVLQALLRSYTTEARFLRYANEQLKALFPYLPKRPAYNKRPRRSAQMMAAVTRALANACSAWWDDLWLVGSTPVECGRSRETAKRSDFAGWAPPTATAPATAAGPGGCDCTSSPPRAACR